MLNIRPRRDDKILILGAQGNLGSQLMRILGNDFRLLCWDREDIDVTNTEKLKKKILEHRPNVIINTVAYNAVDKCEESDEEFLLAMKLNAELPGKLADLALELDAIFVHFVSDYVFSGDKKEGYKENDEARPISRYGESKLAGEKEVLARRDKGLKYYLIRTSKLFGPRGASEGTKPSFFDLMLDLSTKRDSLDVVDSEVSCFTYTVDLAREVKKLIEEKKERGIYHIVNTGAVTWYEAVRQLFKLTKNKTKINPVKSEDMPRPAKRPAFSELKNTKLKPLRSYQDALKEYLKETGS